MGRAMTDRTPTRRRAPPVLRVVPPSPPPIDQECVEALEQLLNLARAGQLVGIAFAAVETRPQILRRHGECHRNPVFARGMVAALDDELAESMSL